MRFSQDFIDKVRESNNIVEIIGQYTELKGSGHRRMGRCPFPDHNEKTPSFSVTDDNQLFYCYGCKKGGNVYNFLQYFNGMSFPESVEFLARRAHIALPEREDGSPGKSRGPSRDDKETLLKLNKLTAVFYHQQLKNQPAESAARKYLEKRGLNEEIVDKFRLGLAVDEWQDLVNHFEARKAPLDSAEVLGLIKPKKGGRPGDSHFDLFRDRLMFPIFSPTGDVIGFGGRTLGDSLPKYVNSSDSPVFHKGKIFYGLHETGRYIRAEDEAIVVEGYMDAIALYAAGIKNVVAILGTAFTMDHAKLLKRFTLNVKMLLDGDEAGISGAERSLPILLEAGLMAKGFVLPENMDPDDYVKANGAEQLRTEIDRAPELFNLLLNRRWLEGYHGSPSEKIQVIDQAAMVLRGMQNQQLMDLYALELSRQLDVDVPWLRRALQQSIEARQPVANAGAAVRGAGAPGPSAPGYSSSMATAALGPVAMSRPAISSRPTPVGSRPLTATASASFQRTVGTSPAASGPAANRAAPATGGKPVGMTSAARSPVATANRPGASPSPPDFSGEPFPGEDFRPMGADLESFESENSPVEPEEESPPLISMKDAPRDEALALSLLLHSRELFAEAGEHGPEELLKVLSHLGIKQVLALAVEKYRQSPGSFASLAASLASQIDQPGIITCSLGAIRTFTSGSSSQFDSSSGSFAGTDSSDTRGAGGNSGGNDGWSREERPAASGARDSFRDDFRSTKNPDDEVQERRLMSDYFTAIRKRFLKTQAHALAHQLRDQASPEKLEQFMNIQRDRLSLKRD